MGALGGSWYLRKGINGNSYSSEPCVDAINIDELMKELRGNDKEEPNQRRNSKQSRYNNYNTMVTEMNTITDMVQTLVLKHNSDEIKNFVISITKQDKIVGITFTTDFLIVMAVNDYVTGCIPIILYARNFSIDTVYTRFLSTVGKMAIKGYSSRYFGGRIPESHLRNGQLRKDYHCEAVQLAIKMDEIIKKDLKI